MLLLPLTGGGRSLRHAGPPLRRTAGLHRQFAWCFSRALLLKSREPLAIFTQVCRDTHKRSEDSWLIIAEPTSGAPGLQCTACCLQHFKDG
jgi:hypothetical protein